MTITSIGSPCLSRYSIAAFSSRLDRAKPMFGKIIKPGMDLYSRDQRSKVGGILGDYDQIFIYTSLKNLVIRHSTAAKVKRMLGNMVTRDIEITRQSRRQTFIDEQLHRRMPT